MMTILSKRKARWADQFKPKKLKGGRLNPSSSAVVKYYEALEKLIMRMQRETQREIEALFRKDFAQEHFAEDASVSSQARILTNALQRKFDDLFNFKAKGISDDVAKDANRSSAAQLKSSLAELAGGITLKTDFLTKELGNQLAAITAENVALIKSIPEQYLTNVTGAVMRSITTGNGLEDLVPFLQKQGEITLRRARLIAHDQTRKAFNNINRARLQKVGVQEFEWVHSGGGQHPRPHHKNVLNGKTYSFANLPVIDPKTGERGIPGQLINCRCTMRPIIKFDTGEAEE